MHSSESTTILENIKYGLETVDKEFSNSFDSNLLIIYLLRSLNTKIQYKYWQAFSLLWSEEYMLRLVGKELGESGLEHLL